MLTDDEKRKKYDTFGSVGSSIKALARREASIGRNTPLRVGKDERSATDWGNIFGGNSATSDFFRTIFGQEFRAAMAPVFPAKAKICKPSWL